MAPIVVDANVVVSAFLKDGASRELILDGDLDLRSPPWLWEEIAARYDWLRERTGLSMPALDLLLRQLRERILDVPADAIEKYRAEGLARVGSANRKDAPYVATVLAVDGVLWTHDKRLVKSAKVRTVTTASLWDDRKPA